MQFDFDRSLTEEIQAPEMGCCRGRASHVGSRYGFSDGSGCAGCVRHKIQSVYLAIPSDGGMVSVDYKWWNRRHALDAEEWLIFCTGVCPAVTCAVKTDDECWG